MKQILTFKIGSMKTKSMKTGSSKTAASFLLALVILGAPVFCGACEEKLSGSFESYGNVPQDISNIFISFGHTWNDDNNDDNYDFESAAVHWDLPEDSTHYNGVLIKFDMLDIDNKTNYVISERELLKERVTDLKKITENIELPADHTGYNYYVVTVWTVNTIGELSKGYDGTFQSPSPAFAPDEFKKVIYIPEVPETDDGGEGEKHTEFVPENVRYTISGLDFFTNGKGLTLNGWTAIETEPETSSYYYEGEKYEFENYDEDLTLYALWSDGSAAHPYLIWHQGNFRGGLEYITTTGADKNYKVVQSFTITPPYTAPLNFSGTFDGNTIIDLETETEKFFKKTITWNAGTAMLSPTSISGGVYGVGIFASITAGALIKNVYVTGSIKFTCKDGEVEAGGIAGLALGSADSAAAIKNCHSDVNIWYAPPPAISDCQDTDIGGIAGAGTVNITNCYNTGNIRSYTNAGGIIGKLAPYTSIENSYSSSYASSLSDYDFYDDKNIICFSYDGRPSYAGGIAGGINQDGCRIINCAALNYKVAGNMYENRIAAKEELPGVTVEYSNNFGSEDMKGHTWTNDPAGPDGWDMNRENSAANIGWWKYTLGWADLFEVEYVESEETPWTTDSDKEKPPVLWFEAIQSA